MKLMLDTSAYTALKHRHAQAEGIVRSRHEIVFSMAVVGELLAGFRYGSRFEDNLEDLRLFLTHPRVRPLPITLDTSDRYGRIFAQLRRKGRPIPSNDMWIAAQAMESGAELLTFDRHFREVDGLALKLLSET